jgi:molybdenum cofactor cytidylyltransferase
MRIPHSEFKDRSSKTAAQVSAILLAAGRSRRMGAFKPLLSFGQITVIESCIANLRAAGIPDIVVVVGHQAGEVQEALKNCQVRFALNEDPESEMSVSIARGVAQLGPDRKGVLIALVDQPAVPPGVIERLICEWRDTKSKLIQPEYGGRGGHPVLVDLGYREELLNLDPECGLRSLFESHRDEIRRVPVDSPYVARDLDTWEDYRQLHQDVFGRWPDA